MMNVQYLVFIPLICDTTGTLAKVRKQKNSNTATGNATFD